LFQPAGEAALIAFDQAWSEIDRTPLDRTASTPDAIAAAISGETVVAATLSVSGSITGRVRILAAPSVIMAPAERHPMVPADPALIAAALGAVPVEIRVELATVPIKMSELSQLGPGSQIPLPVFIDEPMPIYCGDVLKAWGRPVVTRGVLAVEIAAVATPGGGRT
jgi:flagellar motor switch/type III secretory pathway protein FliN